ncbi:glycosyltransferase involved in cell wall biosynthesis [Lacibacter cauensis]|uniref:Glycosyltransferase involved in cell wall biosynthesis n=1 Tax=Lacibacter cauensis TaxID=510947 RepID=A0A562SPM6_9BACT|nr:glycosyltransferase family 2 protein [Lacibacter cauensis]TWI82994.1 glycosyltransferase involved in cell wall biosynthesis [Lacibacter cauensis]
MNNLQNDNQSVFVLVPSYNENEVLRDVVSMLVEKKYSVVVIDDGSTIRQSLYLKNLPVHYIRHKLNLGQGAALQTGTNFALSKGATYIVHFDADGQHSAKDVATLLHPLEDDTIDIVFGSRFLVPTLSGYIPIQKKILLFFGRYINYIFSGLLLSDAHNGLRAMTSKASTKIILTENRMAHASEILFLVKKNRLRFTEVSVSISYTDYSKSKGQPVWNSIRIFFDLILHKLFE